MLVKDSEFLSERVMFLKIIGVWSINFESCFPKCMRRFIQPRVFSCSIFLFWLVIGLHLTVLHVKTLLDSMTEGQKIDDIILILITTCIYVAGNIFMVYFKIREADIKSLIEFAGNNFYVRSAPGLLHSLKSQ